MACRSGPSGAGAVATRPTGRRVSTIAAWAASQHVRQPPPAATISTPKGLQLRHEPVAGCRRLHRSSRGRLRRARGSAPTRPCSRLGPSRASRTSPTLRVESPSTKPARMARSIFRCAPCIALQHLGRAETPGARHPELDIAELAQEMARIVAVAPVARGEAIETVEPAIDRLGDPSPDDLGKGLAAERAVALAPLQPIRLHLLHGCGGHG